MILVAVATALGGCSTAEPIKAGPDTYVITTTHILAVGTQANAQALQAATKHCASMGRQFQMVNIQSSSPAFASPGAATLTYKCVVESAAR